MVGLYYTLIEFDLTNLPKVASSAKIELFAAKKKKENVNTEMYLDRITEFWDWRIQGTGLDRERLWWADRPSAVQWDPNFLPAPIAGRWYSIGITDLYNAWQDGTYENYGIQLRPLRPSYNWNIWNEFRSSDYLADPSLRPKLVVEVPAFSITFPLFGYTPYNAPVGSVFDHSESKDGIVKAYNGEEGKCENGAAKYKKDGTIIPLEEGICENIEEEEGVLAYKNENGTIFLNGVLNYSLPGSNYLWYDGHVGYDYSVRSGTLVRATAAGKLYRAKKDPVNGGGWKKFHTFYIDHGNGYSSWYLHCKSLGASIKYEIKQKGFANVSTGQVIGKSGKKGAAGPHLHFEVRKGGIAREHVIDPYKENLWE
jgi:prepilin-type processing-associated H-X9-DG protein